MAIDFDHLVKVVFMAINFDHLVKVVFDLVVKWRLFLTTWSKLLLVNFDHMVKAAAG